MESKKIIIAGGSGFLGELLTQFFYQKGYEIFVLTRNEKHTSEFAKSILWDGKNIGKWTEILDGTATVINIAGRSVNCRYTAKNKQEIIDSRVNATEVLGLAISQSKNPPKVWINASSSAIYGFSEDEIKDEKADTASDFPAFVCTEWEKAFNKYNTPQTRKVTLRIGVVLQRKKGLIVPFLRLVQFGLGGTIGTGKQYFTWIHQDDFLSVVDLAIENANIKGVINVASPEPITNEVFMKSLRKAHKMAFGLPNFSFLVTIGGYLIGTEPVLVLKGRRIISSVLPQHNFTFQYPEIETALENLINDKSPN